MFQEASRTDPSVRNALRIIGDEFLESCYNGFFFNFFIFIKLKETKKLINFSLLTSCGWNIYGYFP